MSRFSKIPIKPNPNGKFAKFKALIDAKRQVAAPVAKTPATTPKQPVQTANAAPKVFKPAKPRTVSAESLKKRLAADAQIDREVEAAIERKKTRDEIANAWSTAIRRVAGSTRGNAERGPVSVWETAITRVTGSPIVKTESASPANLWDLAIQRVAGTITGHPSPDAIQARKL